MANGLFQKMIQGVDRKDDYAKSTLPTNRFSLFWDVLKGNFFKLVLVNFLILLFFVPLFLLLLMRFNVLSFNAEQLPFSANLFTGYPIVPLPQGQEALLNLLSNRAFYMLFPVAMLIGGIGLSGGLYVIRNLVWTEGVLTLADFWRGIGKNVKSVLATVCLFSLFAVVIMFGVDYINYMIAVGKSVYWFLVLIRTLCYLLLAFGGMMTAYMLTMGVTYNMNIFKLLKNSFMFSFALIITNVIFFFLAALPILLLLWMNLSAFYLIILMMDVFIGVSFALLLWTTYSQWAYDKFINPQIEGAKVDRGIYKKEKTGKESAAFRQYREQKTELLKSMADDHLISTPIKPIDDDIEVTELPEHYTRKDLERLKEQKEKMVADAAAWAEEHKDDEKYKFFTEIKEDAEKKAEERRKKLESYKNASNKRKKGGK